MLPGPRDHRHPGLHGLVRGLPGSASRSPWPACPAEAFSDWTGPLNA